LTDKSLLKNLKIVKTFFIIWFYILSSSASNTVPPSALLSSPFHMAYKGAGVASLAEDFSHLLNPAALGFQKKSKIAAAYSTKQNKYQMLSLVWADLTTKIPVSINYERYWTAPLFKSDFYRTSLSMGMALNSFFSIGLKAQQEVLSRKKFWDGQLGVLFRVTPQTGLGMTLNNLFSDNLTKQGGNDRMIFGFYQKFLKTMSTRLDWTYTKSKDWIFRGSLETLFKQFLSVRVGGSWDFKATEAAFGGGLSLYGPRLQLDYNIERQQLILQHALILKLLM